MTMKTFDMEKYIPGEYEITIRCSAGITNKVEAEVILTLTLMDPCPTSQLSNLLETPFEDVIYILGAEEVF